MLERLKKWVQRGAKKAKGTPKITISTVDTFAVGSTKTFNINDWSVVYTFAGNAPSITDATTGDLLRTITDPKYKDCWSGDVFAVKVLIKSGEINERNYP